MTIRIKLSPGATLARSTEGASGYDLVIQRIDDFKSWRDVCSDSTGKVLSIVLRPDQAMCFFTGVYLELPRGMEAQVRPLSSLSRRGMVAHLGTIDSDYRGEVFVSLTNVSRGTHQLALGQRIAQLVFAKVEHPDFEIVTELSPTPRGISGFGSSGV